MTQEHQEYIQSKVNPTLENLVTQVLLERPDNPVPFMIRWLAEQTKSPASVLDTGEAAKLRKEIQALQAEVSQLQSKLESDTRPAADDGTKGAPSQAAPTNEEEEDDDDDVDDLPPPPVSSKKQRASVSAEAYGAWNQRKEFTPPVHPKSDEQKTQIMGVLKSSFLFKSLEDKALNTVVDAVISKTVEPGSRIIQEGEDGDVMFVIMDGTFECKKKLDGEEKVVKTCGPGDFFGELSLLYNCPRAASVEAQGAASVCQLDRETFNHIVRDASMQKREFYEEFLKGVPLLEKLGTYERAQLADCLTTQRFNAGDVIINQGEEGDRFYLVEEGQLSATKNGSEVMSYKRGDYFGELSLIQNDVRAATVTATSDGALCWINTKSFKSLLGGVEDMMKSKAQAYSP